MKKTILSFLLAFSIITLGLTLQTSIVSAQTTTNPLRYEVIDKIGKELNDNKTPLPSYTDNPHAKSSKVAGVSNIGSAAYYIIEFMKYILGAIATLLVIISGVKLVLSSEKTDEAKQKEVSTITYAIVGFVVIMIAEPLVKQAFFGQSGEILQNQETAIQYATQGSGIFKSIYRVIQSIIATMSVLMFVFSGIQYALSAWNEDQQKKARNRILWGSVGIVLVAVSEFVVYDVLFPNKGSALPDTQKGSQLFVSLTNFLSAFIATLSIVGLIYAGFLYVTAGVSEDNIQKAKKVVFGSIVGILMAAAAFAFVSTLSSGLTPQ